MRFVGVFICASILFAGCNALIFDDPDFIIIGDDSNMKIETLDLLLKAEENWTEEQVIIDLPGNFDIEIVSRLQFSAGGSLSDVTFRSTNGQLEWLGENVDTIYYYTESEVDSVSQIGRYFVTDWEIGSCDPALASDTFKIQEVQEFYFLPLNKGVEVSIEDSFFAKPVMLSDRTTKIEEGLLMEISETNFYRVNSRTFIACNDLPRNEEVYISFRLHQNRRSRLGWLKVNSIGGNEIHIIESAVSR